MKKPFLILFSLFISGICLSQNGFYIGYENGGLFDRFHYVNSKGFELTQTSIGGVLGGIGGYKYKSYSIETGFYGYYSYHPMIEYDYTTSEVNKSNSSGSGAENWVIPIRLGMEFLTAKRKLFIKPEIAFDIFISRDYSESQPTMGWGENVSAFPGDPNFIPTTSDSTRAYGYISSKMNFGIETSLSIGYRFRQKVDLFIKGSYLANFSPLYYETITHYSNIETVSATDVNVNSFLMQIGLKYYFAKREK